MDDLAIIELYFARDEKAIRETDIKYGRLCFSVAVNVLGNDEDSEECVNDTYLSMWNTIPPTRPNRFAAFICRITRNLSLKRLEYNKAQKRTPTATVSFHEFEDFLPDNTIMSDVDDQEIDKKIGDFLRTKSPVVRTVFIRKYWFFDTVSDIAAKYSFTESKVKSMLYHTRNELREYLRKEGIEV
ncbi:MAG: sigma-70 family RNA polymerase sigma factor [Lachnospiraceae bacterium]|nr:sigma-70 family RNA polymerase sigma factor [Lachnospiraceae bacterium]